MCHPTPQVTVTQLPSVNEQKAIVKTDSIASKHYTDSVQIIIKQANKAAENFFNEWQASEDRYNDLEKGMTDLFDKQPIPDTCKVIVAQLNEQFKRLSQSSKQKDNACTMAIEGQKAIVRQKDVVIGKQTIDFARLKENLDISINAQTSLNKQIKQLKPKREIYVGANVVGNPEKYLAAYGASIGFMNKKHTQIEVGAFQMKSVIYYQLSFKKTLFRL